MKASKGAFEVTHRYHSQGLAAGGSALLDAINRGKVHLAKFILDAGECDVVNTRDFKGKTPVIRACYIKEEKTRGRAMVLLLNRGADVNLQDDVGRTALSYACEIRCNDIVRLLIQNNVDPDIPDDKGNTALIYSAMVGNDTAIELLTRSFRRLGISVDHVNNDGMTALLTAAKNGFIECATTLALDGRACISFCDREKGWTAEQWARANGCSTPEVLPFSTGAALWQYKMQRYGHLLTGSGDDGNGQNATDEGGNENPPKCSAEIEQMTRRLMDLNKPERPKSAISRTSLGKRGSLPSMKLTSPLASREGTPTRTHKPFYLMEEEGKSSPPELKLRSHMAANKRDDPGVKDWILAQSNNDDAPLLDDPACYRQIMKRGVQPPAIHTNTRQSAKDNPDVSDTAGSHRDSPRSSTCTISSMSTVLSVDATTK